jgi:Ribbon-helix-helix protein, copG family
VSKDRDTKVAMVSGGVPLTEADLDRLVDEAERGYPLDRLRPVRPGRPSLGQGTSPAIQVRLDPRAYKALQEHIAETGLNTSTIVREALAQYLSLPE